MSGRNRDRVVQSSSFFSAKRMFTYKKEKHCLYNLSRTNHTFTFAYKNSKQSSLPWTDATDYKRCLTSMETFFPFKYDTIYLGVSDCSERGMTICSIGTFKVCADHSAKDSMLAKVAYSILSCFRP